MTYLTIESDIDSHGILTITLSRAEKMNAFTVEMSKELIDAYDTASENDRVKVIVLTGKGKAFCAGMDLSSIGNVFGLEEGMQPTMQDLQFRSDEPIIREGVLDTGGQVTLSMYRCKKPIIAAINGVAVGIGATMTCAADIRIASTHAKIGFVFSKLGIVPEACSSWFLPRIVGISRALEWVYRGDILSAHECYEGGLLKSVVEPDELLTTAHSLAEKIASRSAVSVAMMRQMMYRNSALADPIHAHHVESLAMYYTSQKDGKEGVQAFLEKRETNFDARVSQDLPPFVPWW